MMYAVRAVLLGLLLSAGAACGDEINYANDIKPILATKCFACHGALKQEAGLRLDAAQLIRAGGDSGPAITPGSSQDSLLIARVAAENISERMPPEGEGEALSAEQLAKLRLWIDQGAPAPEEPIPPDPRQHWAYQPPTRANTPPSIDAFLAVRHAEAGLTPAPFASKEVLLRRVYLDLIGLPPSREEVQAFMADDSPQAYERVVDRLLESPQYGERWARHWMDVARFAESHGYEQDYDRPHAYHYRDFLIQALNDDLPYDTFVQWQIAGDELAPENPLAMMATGFLGAGAFPTQLTEAEFESARYDELDDMVGTLGTAVLGLSIGCARCHDHKFDPISSVEYYRLASIFTTTIRSEIEMDIAPGPEEQLATVQVTSEGYPHMKHHADDRGFPHFYPETYVLARGDVHQKQEVATPGYLSVLMRPGTDVSTWAKTRPDGWERTRFTRAGLADWITDVPRGAGALTARVMVNRLWHHHFGRGIVATPSDFGFQGERPTHPELLEWLAVDFVQHGWKLKRLHKLIMTSAVYMQNGAFDEDRATVDRENHLLWRRPPRRLEAEAIRDAMLHVSGLLDTTMYGPGTLDESMRRRSVYFFIKRSQLIPMMMLFDWPEHLVGIGQRATTTIAPQALMFMNSPQARVYAEGLAKRLPAEPQEGIARAYELALGRAPTSDEQARAAEFIEQQQRAYAAAATAADGTVVDPDRARHLAWTDFCQVLMGMNEFVYVP